MEEDLGCESVTLQPLLLPASCPVQAHGGPSSALSFCPGPFCGRRTCSITSACLGCPLLLLGSVQQVHNSEYALNFLATCLRSDEVTACYTVNLS